ncbi:uncharacterized protein LOC117302971 [Asterias rubens]|uniref:uncharacterized protein LOC117302971 n=1 Tax=Asterias rubens TaxID=7604 RepID=UPI001454E529|nr:uncharacterized protein LOC117302971 [Asterias rubens]
MANVFTRRYRRPRTTTLTDFSCTNDQTKQRSIPRIFSPTRRQNPHSIGLVYQSPYNKDNHTFGIWSPDFNLFRSRFPEMSNHIGTTNWTCCRDSRKVTLPRAPSGKPPEIRYTLDSTSRRSYEEPARAFPQLIDAKQKTTRFGNTPYTCTVPARGIVPNVLPPIATPDENTENGKNN